MQADVYTILCFSEIPLPIDDILPDFVFFTSPHERSTDPIPINFEVTLQASTHERSADIIPRTFEVTLKATKPMTLVYIK